MGEYAIRKSDGERIKIGTCEEMYYLRFEDRDKVQHEPGNVDPVKDAGELRFRLPFPDEDEVQPGEYEDFNRGERLYRMVETPAYPAGILEDFEDAETADDPGTIQVYHQASGMLLNLPCYHGNKLPDLGPNCRVFWNGKSYFLELFQLRGVKTEAGLQVFPVVRCRHCSKAWRYQWADVLDFIPDLTLRGRLAVYAQASAVAA